MTDFSKLLSLLREYPSSHAPSLRWFMGEADEALFEEAIGDQAEAGVSVEALLAGQPSIRRALSLTFDLFVERGLLDKTAYTELKKLIDSFEQASQRGVLRLLDPRGALASEEPALDAHVISDAVFRALSAIGDHRVLAKKGRIPVSTMMQMVHILSQAETDGAISGVNVVYLIRTIDEVILPRLKMMLPRRELVGLRDALLAYIESNEERSLLLFDGLAKTLGWELITKRGAPPNAQRQTAELTAGINDQFIRVRMGLDFSPDGTLIGIDFMPFGDNAVRLRGDYIERRLLRLFANRYPSVKKVALHLMGVRDVYVWERRPSGQWSHQSEETTAQSPHRDSGPVVAVRSDPVLVKKEDDSDKGFLKAKASGMPILGAIASDAGAQLAFKPDMGPDDIRPVSSQNSLFHIVGAQDFSPASELVFDIVGAISQEQETAEPLAASLPSPEKVSTPQGLFALAGTSSVMKSTPVSFALRVIR